MKYTTALTILAEAISVIGLPVLPINETVAINLPLQYQSESPNVTYEYHVLNNESNSEGINSIDEWIENHEVEVSTAGNKPYGAIDKFWKSVEKFTTRESLYEAIAKEVHISPFQAMKRLNQVVNVFWGSGDTVKCKDTGKNYKGLCLTSGHRIIYKNENRASRHLFRSIFMPVHGYLTMRAINWTRYYICNYEIYDPIRDYINCNMMQYYQQLTEVIFAGLFVLGYQELTGKPFYTIAVKLARAYSAVGYQFAGYNAVSYEGQVVPFNAMPYGFNLSYVFSNYGDPDGRNASLAIFPGNKDSELGFSFISKPWDPAPVAPSVPGSYMNIETYHWKYVFKVDLDEINYQLDLMSPEELLHSALTSISNIKDYLYFGGGLFADKHDFFLKVDDLEDDQDEEQDDDFEESIPLSDEDDEVFKVNFHGLKIRISLEKNSSHTVHWKEH